MANKIEVVIDYINDNFHLRWRGEVLEFNGVPITPEQLKDIKGLTDKHFGKRVYNFDRIINSESIKDA